LAAQQRLATTRAAALSQESAHDAPRSTETNAMAMAPTRTYRDEGAGTAVAALQTFAWACDRGDTAAVKQLLAFDPDARAKIETYFESLPLKRRLATPRWRPRHHGDGVGDHAQSIPSAQVLDLATTEPLSENRVQVDVPERFPWPGL